MATVSPSSAPERRGQASPTAALVAVAAVGIGLSLYATVFAGVVPTADRDVATPTLSAVHEAVAPAGVAGPARLEAAAEAGPTGWSVRVELRTGPRQWTAGTAPAPGVDRQSAGRRVPVRVSPGQVQSGWLRVVVHR
ncbi:DUF7285 family protein [Halolamina salifodinae]|uniref:Uncharacterized protein n=1 Tax=Halolamina salifodinae TaxID=1202767 RepID=A0A8T4GW70_9EURY|nr:hypothetical protein [Halolamina salifodinae]MBP1985585.1 hypothetical protein [Halolamina salifodinae]